MDLKVFYQKLRQVESSILEPHAVIVSHETSDGGRAGVCTEVPREVAARMIVESRAHLASDEEAMKFREQMAEAKRLAERLGAASKMQVTVVTDTELRRLRSGLKNSKP